MGGSFFNCDWITIPSCSHSYDYNGRRSYYLSSDENEKRKMWDRFRFFRYGMRSCLGKCEIRAGCIVYQIRPKITLLFLESSFWVRTHCSLNSNWNYFLCLRWLMVVRVYILSPQLNLSNHRTPIRIRKLENDMISPVRAFQIIRVMKQMFDAK